MLAGNGALFDCIGGVKEEPVFDRLFDDVLGKLKQVRRTKCRELDFDARTTPIFEISAKTKQIVKR